MSLITPEIVEFNEAQSEQWIVHAVKVGFVPPWLDDGREFATAIDVTDDGEISKTIGRMVVGLLGSGHGLEPWTLRHLHQQNRWALMFSNGADAVTARMVS